MSRGAGLWTQGPLMSTCWLHLLRGQEKWRHRSGWPLACEFVHDMPPAAESWLLVHNQLVLWCLKQVLSLSAHHEHCGGLGLGRATQQEDEQWEDELGNLWKNLPDFHDACAVSKMQSLLLQFDIARLRVKWVWRKPLAPFFQPCILSMCPAVEWLWPLQALRLSLSSWSQVSIILTFFAPVSFWGSPKGLWACRSYREDKVGFLWHTAKAYPFTSVRQSISLVCCQVHRDWMLSGT